MLAYPLVNRSVNEFKSVLQDDTVLELLEDGAMFTLGSESQFPDWEAMWKQELSRDDTKRPKGLHTSDMLPSPSKVSLTDSVRSSSTRTLLSVSWNTATAHPVS